MKLVFILLCVTIGVNTKNCWTKSGLSASEKALFVTAHNKLRQKVMKGEVCGQPPAEQMPNLRWQDELAQAAQELANKCEYEHTPKGQENTKNFKGYGQNLAQSSSSEANDPLDPNDIVQGWFDEVITPGGFVLSNTHYKDEDEGGEETTGHYSQVIWAGTKYVGCGFVTKPSTEPDMVEDQLVVCNYWPAGNVEGKTAYKASDTPKC